MFCKSRSRAAAWCVLAAIAAAGCSHNDSPPPQPIVVNPPAAAPVTAVATSPGGTVVAGVPSTNNTNAGAGGATGTETGVADAVNKAIHNNTQMTGSRVTAVVNSAGEARLTGTAQNAQQKAMAESTARQTSGVSGVINKIEIVPTGGAKSAAKTAVKTIVKEHTKVVVVHDGAAASPAATDGSSTVPGSAAAPANGDAAGNASGTASAPADTSKNQ